MYKPNFCADCGEKIERDNWRWWTNGRFCQECERHLEPWQKRVLSPLLAAIVLLGVGVLAGRMTQEKKPPIMITNNQAAANFQTTPRSNIQPLTANQQPAAKTTLQTNAVAQTNQSPNPPNAAQPTPPIAQIQATEATYFCGAKTQKGTPCTRRVRGGGRCWQHVGKPAMLPDDKLLIRN